MSHYSDNPAACRVDFFKPSGKWYMTEAVEFVDYDDPDIHAVFERSLKQALGGRGNGFTAVCLEPYHAHAHPLMLRIPEGGF